MDEQAVLWVLRGLLGLITLWVAVLVSRPIRVLRSQRYGIRPSVGQGLVGSYTPTVSLIVPAPSGRAPHWLDTIDYPEGRLERIVVAPRRPGRNVAAMIRVPEGCRAIVTRGGLVAPGLRAARGRIVVVVPPRVAAAPDLVKRLVAPLADPFVGASVGRVDAGRPRAGLVGRLDDIERLARRGIRVGQTAMGGALAAEDEPFAVRLSTIVDVGGMNTTNPRADTQLLLSVYARGYAISYVEDALVLAAPADWRQAAHRQIQRTIGLRRSWRLVRRMLRRNKVLEGPEKTDVRLAGRGATMASWLTVAWLLCGGLRLADHTFAPEVFAGVLLLMTMASPGSLLPAPVFTTAAVQSGRLRMLALQPWLWIFALGAIWTQTGASVAAALRIGDPARTGRRRR